MKICVLSHTYIPKVNRKKWEILSEKYGMDVSIIIPYYWRDTLRVSSLNLDEKNLKIYPLDTFFNGSDRLCIYKCLGKRIKEIRPDILHIEEEPWSVSCFSATRLKKNMDTKSVFFTWENVFHNYRFPFSYFEKFTLNNSNFAIAGNQDAKDILIKKGIKCPVEVIPQLGIDPNEFQKFSVSGLKNQLNLTGFVIGYIGRFVPEKGLDTLLFACSKLKSQYKDFQMLMVGDGPYRDALIALSRDLGIEDRIIFVDPVPHAEVPRYLNCVDVLVLPSITTPKWKEQFGHILIEAMACEIPVIGSSSGEIPNVIGDAGLVFEERSQEKLAEKLYLLIHNKELREKLSQMGRKRVFENYSLDKIAENTYSIYTRLSNK